MTVEPLPVARQARSRLTQGRILDTAYALIAESGADALTMNAVAERAGVAVGSVYRRFGDKDRLLLAVQSEFANRVKDEVARQFESLDRSENPTPEVLVAHAVGSMAYVFRQHEHLLRVFLVLGVGNSTVYAAGSQASTASNKAFQDFLREIPIGHDDRTAALDFVFRLLYSSLAHRVTQGEHLESDRPLPWEELQGRLVTCVTRYLLPSE